MNDGPQKKHFRTSMPHIPGVPDHSPEAEEPRAPSSAAAFRFDSRTVILLGIAVVMVVGAGVWWMTRSSRPQAEAPPPSQAVREAALPAPLSTGVPRLDGTIEVGMLDEFNEPWSSKRFVFRKPITGETIEAIVVRLPGAATNSASYWGFALQAPYGRCELEWVRDLSRLAAHYGYRARHPMAGDPCTGTVYDPLRIGTVPGGAWVRGEVVQGAGIRPPLAIDIRVQGNRVVATQME